MNSPESQASQIESQAEHQRERLYVQIRSALQARLGHMLKISDHGVTEQLSLIEIINVIFAMSGTSNTLGSYQQSVEAIFVLVGTERLWRRKSEEAAAPTLVQ